MPLPKTKNVGKVISFLKKEKPSMSQRQRVAIALNTAREAGAKIPKKRDKTKFVSSDGMIKRRRPY